MQLIGNFFLLLISLCLVPSEAFSMLPVVDTGAIVNLAKQYRQLKSQYDLLRQTYQNAQHQLRKAEEIARNSQGHYGYGKLLNGAKELKNRSWSPDRWQDALNGISGGNPARYQQLLAQYKKNNKVLAPEVYKKGASDEKAALYQNQVKHNRAASVNATYAFNNIKHHIKNIHDISAQIESSNNTKAAIDLSNRMQAEMGYVQVQILKQIALLNEQVAQTHAQNIEYETQNARFNSLPN